MPYRLISLIQFSRDSFTKLHTSKTHSCIKKYSKAFSLIELVFVITLFGMLLATIPSVLSLGQKLCYTKLAQELNTLQEQLSLLYTKHTLLSTPPSKDIVLMVIASHHINTPNCSLIFNNNRLSAHVFGGKTNFTLDPQDLSVQPSFKCAFSSNLVCREILMRMKKQ